MVDAGVRVALSSDNLTLSGDPLVAGAWPLHGELSYAHPAGEVAHLVAHCGFSWAEARELLLTGVRAAFAPEADEVFVAEFEAAVDRVLAEEGVTPHR
jgi:adenosine deaminase